MADVIFNGSNSRQPVGQASIELVFDNSEGKAGGAYAQYNEISVKRLVSRDGQSLFYLNNTRCRRRDITDLFLGTGLGPRSYAIIEQGTISRIIEAKPDELRLFLEEAAGISRYKERRRETENRIQHTLENLNRLNDLRDELERQLKHLQRQARTAERYQALKDQERLLKVQLLGVRWRSVDRQVKEEEQSIQKLQIRLEASTTQLRGVEAEIEKQRQAHQAAGEAYNEVQQRFYTLGTEIARLEQTLKAAKERGQRLREELEQLRLARQEANSAHAGDEIKRQTLAARLQALQPALKEAQQAERTAARILAEAEQAMHSWQRAWEEFHHQQAALSQSAQVHRTEIDHLERQLERARQRVDRLQMEYQGLPIADLEEASEALAEQLAEVDGHHQELERMLQTRAQMITELRQRNAERAQDLDGVRGDLQKARGRHASLDTLQQVALGKRHGAVTAWLERQGLEHAPRLAETLEVEAGWERAVETVLGPHLEAVCVDGLDPVVALLADLERGTMALFDRLTQVVAKYGTLAPSLLSKVRSAWRLDSVLAGIYAVDSLAQALDLRDRLAASQSVVTRDGIWLGSGWLRVTRDADERTGVLHREQELKQLNLQIAQLEERTTMLQEQLQQGRDRLLQLEQEREVLQQELTEVSRRQAAVQAQLSATQAQLEQEHQRRLRIEDELQELQMQSAQEQEEIQSAQEQLAEALVENEALEQRREELREERNRLEATLDQARNHAQVARDEAHRFALEEQSTRTQVEAVSQGLERLVAQLDQLESRWEVLGADLDENEAPLSQMATELQHLLDTRLTEEMELGDARTRLHAHEERLQNLEKARSQTDRETQVIRDELAQVQMAQEGLKARRQAIQDQIEEAGFSVEEAVSELPAEASETAWEEQVKSLEGKIQRLGPVNLAAIDEYRDQAERKNYLDTQYADLTDALTTLESAIRKMDQETRARFKETFNKVDEQIKVLFPRLFGGGQASLELTGDDLLNTGVTVMARPPGKKNTTIHLLSGGEKALTAVALVFAIFALNPAPFCMLDEVDAPLDDANVGRFCDLVQEMSSRIQFIFITHNKTTMEMAHQLTGVTMQEPGVSRLVAVDVDEAVELAALAG